MKLINAFLLLLATTGEQITQLAHAEKDADLERGRNNRNLRSTQSSTPMLRCTSVETQYEMLLHGNWISMPMAGGTKCCPSSTEGKIETVHMNVPCPSSVGGSTGTGASDGDQHCIYPIETKYKEFYHGEWQTRDTAGGTKCCPHLIEPKRIILQHISMDCPSNSPSSSPSTEPSTSPSDTPSDVPSASPSLAPSESIKPSAQPTRPPSPAPSSFPTLRPTWMPSDEPTSSCSASWTPLAGSAGAIDLVNLSNCDDCVEEVDLGFDFKWLGGTSTISKVHVSTNGHILINPGDADVSYDFHTIGDNNKPRIAVAQEDLDPRVAGNVYMQTFYQSAIISYEQLPFYNDDYPEDEDSGFVNAQAHLFADGRVNICFGNGYITSDRVIAAGLEGGENDNVYGGSEGAIAAPLPGSPFDSVGSTTVFPPAGKCYCFSPSTKSFYQ